jgi:large subunit ribosomal protein L24
MAEKNKNNRKKLHIKVGDKVLVIAGAAKGNTGEVKKVFPKESRAIVEGLNKVKRHVRPTADSPGGIYEKEAPIHLSNLMLVDANGVASRTKRAVVDGKKVRVSTKTQEVID